MALRERPAFSLVFGIVKRGIEDWGPGVLNSGFACR
jgi:hypothetical protein